ncbi:MAG TPA: AsmA family protein [Candidatus Polarisedimenticolia bacterium]|nr:AsmA family protein [Candidatus Polarisedimenticolia bacterium]
MAMPRWVRRGLVALGIVVILALAVGLAAPFLVDVNRYKPAIAGRIRAATGRDVGLGRISLRLLPSIALAVRPLTVAEGPRYPGRDALRAEGLSVRVSLSDLLRGRVTIRAIVLDHPTLTLIRDAQGRWNFDDLLARVRAAPVTAPAHPAASGETLSVAVDRAVLRSGMLRIYDDAVVPGRRSEATVGPIDAKISGWGAGRETTLDLDVGLGASRVSARGRLSLGGEAPSLQASAAADGVKLADLLSLAPWIGVPRPAGLVAGGDVDLHGEATLPLQHPEAVQFKGTLALHGVSYRDATLARPIEAIGGTLAVDGTRATWDDFTVRLGSSSLKGRLQLEDFLRPRVGFTLTSPKLDVNELLAAVSPAAGPVSSGHAPPPEGGTAGGLLDLITAHGTLAVASMRFQNFDLADLASTVDLKRSVFLLQVTRAALYGGALDGAVTVDLGRALPRYRLDVRLQGLEVDPLLGAYDASLKSLLRGRLTGDLQVAASGVAMDGILNSSTGSGSLEIKDGALTSFSVLKQLAQLLETAGGKGIGREETPFESLRATLAIGGGKARTEDLTLHSADLDLAGKGWVGLDASLDLGVTARFSEEATQGLLDKTPRLAELTDAEHRVAVHLRFQGSLASPSVSLDTRAQVRQVQERRKEEVKEKARDRLQDLLRRKLGAQETPTPQP